jgi:hypothetical protein
MCQTHVRAFLSEYAGQNEGTVVSEGTVAVQAFPDVVVRLQDLF